MDIREKIIESTSEIFSSMIMMEVSVLEQEIASHRVFSESISGVIGLAGVQKGVLAIHLPYKVAMAITGNFLGMEVTEIGPDVEDAIGELANMLGGNIKTILSEKGRDIELSMPTTISGKEYDFQSTKNADQYIIPFTTDAGNFIVELQLER